jgi:hypothetical protein
VPLPGAGAGELCGVPDGHARLSRQVREGRERSRAPAQGAASCRACRERSRGARRVLSRAAGGGLVVHDGKAVVPALRRAGLAVEGAVQDTLLAAALSPRLAPSLHAAASTAPELSPLALARALGCLPLGRGGTGGARLSQATQSPSTRADHAPPSAWSLLAAASRTEARTRPRAGLGSIPSSH